MSNFFIRALRKIFCTHFLWFMYISRITKSRKSSSIKLNNKIFHFPDSLGAAWQYKEIFLDEIYYFKPTVPNPTIVDCGSNIGFSIQYYATNFPNSKIYAFEADPEIFKILRNNTSHIKDISLFNNAVWIQDEVLVFYKGDADSGSLFHKSENSVNVKAINLKSFLENIAEIDFMKIDIEGAEEILIPHIRHELKKVKNLFIEYHHWDIKIQSLSKMILILEEQGFRYTLERINKCKAPLDELSRLSPVQINIFATRNC